MTSTNSILKALQQFAVVVTEKMNQLTLGEPEEQLRSPFENLMAGVADAFGWTVVCTGETPLPDRLGRPDFAVHRNRSLAGYIELKAPGFGANARRFKGRNHPTNHVSNSPNTSSINSDDTRRTDLFAAGMKARQSNAPALATSRCCSKNRSDVATRFLRQFSSRYLPQNQMIIDAFRYLSCQDKQQGSGGFMKKQKNHLLNHVPN